jgi:type IV secretion system protein VirB9
LSGCSHISKSSVPDFKLDEVVFEPAIIQPEETESTDAPAKPETVIVERFTAVPLPGQMKLRETYIPRASQSSKSHEIIDTANAGAKVGPNPDAYVNAIQVYPFTKGALYQVFTAPEQVTDIALGAGERLISVSAGDTENWILGDTLSGEGETEQVHILVKPIKSGLTTNLIITTSERVYHAELTSYRETYMAAVSWRYPRQGLISLSKSLVTKSRGSSNLVSKETRASHATPAGLSVYALKFRYEIDGDTPHWRPLRAFDDGRKVYIQFPARIDQGEAPPLFVVSNDGETQLVNYRVKGRYYVVDRLFARAELRLGEKDQQVVRIDRTSS